MSELFVPPADPGPAAGRHTGHPGRAAHAGRHDHPVRVRPRNRLGLVAAVLLLVTAAAGCSSDGAGGSGAAAGRDGPDPAAAGGVTGTGGVTGPLCAALPAGTDPGNPESLAGEPADVALRWLPVLTKFEAAVRAAGLSAELRAPEGITILAPTDDAFGRKFSEDNLDDLMIHQRDKLRTLLRAHLVAGARPLSELIAAGSVTTLDGTRVPVTQATEPMARFGDAAETVCADYRIAGGRIHIVNGVLGNLPTTAGQGEPAH
ncbi:fasciclin domain-containing protein [Plantactinospora sonchi]|uniref:Fasciclin domain-containing protein n=1 Tax=Plantactinospora sonchi TaxID=1544735 RepID=A0ABU7RW30_9ACTN